ncbi:hypothetical protein DBR00_12250 [Pseudomonas sp. HMWF032]|uniref:hypothetical protein n=1 Tax=Pseudomonas sp. HMWF032 TaxID=2056866 RepID=UPI000D381BCF|nr:hypothetical protein [Pseudomonas sp. HMWF032]PTS84130.1 hypothetical protein DBR00_12250 [Pseudomonas sp. HMWF032]PTT78819.1 hypothetical protein DBR41_22725 [Pseudomonas sp. HMWF010]
MVASRRSELALQRSFEDFPAVYAVLRIDLNRGFNIITAPVTNACLQQSYANDNRTNLQQLKRQRMDVYIHDRLSILWEPQQMREQGLLANAGRVISVIPESINKPYKQDFMLRLGPALRSLEADGSIDRLAARYSTINMLPARGLGYTSGNNL